MIKLFAPNTMVQISNKDLPRAGEWRSEGETLHLGSGGEGNQAAGGHCHL